MFQLEHSALSSSRNTVTISRLLAGEVVHRHRVLKQRVVAGDDGDAAVGDEVARAVGFGVVANRRAFGEMDVAVDDAAAYTAMASHRDIHLPEGTTIGYD